MDRFDKFTERARKVLQFAQEEAVGLGHNYVGAEHLLLGLVREGEGVAARVLAHLGADPLNVRAAVHVLTAKQADVHQAAGLTESAKQTIALAVGEANRLNHHFVGTEHLLLGMIRHGEGNAAEALVSLGVSLDQTRDWVIHVLNQSAIYGSRTAGHLEAPGSGMGGRFSKLTDEARQSLLFSQQEAQRLHHNYIGTEHLLLGMIRERESVAAGVLGRLGLELSKVRSAVEFITGRGDRAVTGNRDLTPRAKKVIELSFDEARRLDHDSIGTGHLLLGLVREGEGIAAGVLEQLGANPERVRVEVLVNINRPEAAARPESSTSARRRARVPGQIPLGPASPGPRPRQAARNKAIVYRYFDEVLARGNLDLVDELFAPNFTRRPDAIDREAYKRAVAATRAGFPNIDVSIDDQVAEGDKVVTRWRARGSHQGPYLGVAPTGREIWLFGIHIHRLERGKLVELWEHFDLFGLMQQLGALPPGDPGASAASP